LVSRVHVNGYHISPGSRLFTIGRGKDYVSTAKMPTKVYSRDTFCKTIHDNTLFAI